MSWLSNLFSGNKSPDPLEVPSTGLQSLDSQVVATSIPASDVPAARNLIAKAAKETGRLNGVPSYWLKYEVLTLADANKAYFQVQVTVKHWDPFFFMHTYAFEKAMLERIRHYNLAVGRAVRAVLWRVSTDACCPYEQMPPPEAWTQQAIEQRLIQTPTFLKNKNKHVPSQDEIAALQRRISSNAQADDFEKTVFQDTAQMSDSDNG